MPVQNVSRALLLVAARIGAQAEGHRVEFLRVRGVGHGQRLEYLDTGDKVAVRTSQERLIAFPRQPDGKFRTLGNVNCVLFATMSADGSAVEVVEFPSEIVRGKLDEALREMVGAGSEPPKSVPIFVPLDDKGPRNLGHAVVGLGRLATWTRRVPLSDLVAYEPTESLSDFFSRVRREFAQLSKLDPSQVRIHFSVGE